MKSTVGQRGRVAAAAAVVLVTLSLSGPGSSAAAAPECQNSWTNRDGGVWSDAASWSRGTVPAPGERACIEAPGAYTVSLTAATASIGSLSLGGAAGTVTLAISGSCAGSALLSTSEGLVVEQGGHVTMGEDDACSGAAAIEGPILNRGTITTLGAGGERRLRGDLRNDGTIAIGADTAFAKVGSALENDGRIELDQTLHVSEHTDVRNESGAIVAAGAGELLQSGGKFFEGGGAISGREPVVVDDGNLIYDGGGSGAIVLRGDSGISGAPRHGAFTFPGRGQSLRIQGTCSEAASIGAPAFTNRGTISLEPGDGCGAGITVDLGGQTLRNLGTIEAAEAGGEPLAIQGALVNQRTVAVVPEATLAVAAGYAQSAHGRYVTEIDGPGSFGALETPGPAVIDGALSVSSRPGAALAAGQQFAVLRSGSLSGTFSRIDHARLRADALRFEPLYGDAGAVLRLARARGPGA